MKRLGVFPVPVTGELRRDRIQAIADGVVRSDASTIQRAYDSRDSEDEYDARETITSLRRVVLDQERELEARRQELERLKNPLGLPDAYPEESESGYPEAQFATDALLTWAKSRLRELHHVADREEVKDVMAVAAHMVAAGALLSRHVRTEADVCEAMGGETA